MDKPLFSLCFSLVVVSSFSYEGKDDDLLLTSRNSCGLSAALGDAEKKIDMLRFCWVVRSGADGVKPADNYQARKQQQKRISKACHVKRQSALPRAGMLVWAN